MGVEVREKKTLDDFVLFLLELLRGYNLCVEAGKTRKRNRFRRCEGSRVLIGAYKFGMGFKQPSSEDTIPLSGTAVV